MISVATTRRGPPRTGKADIGRAEGRSPSALLTIPQEWGIKGVERSLTRRPPSSRVCMMDSVDSRFCGNDREESVRLRRTEGLVVDSPQDEGCPGRM